MEIRAFIFSYSYDEKSSCDMDEEEGLYFIASKPRPNTRPFLSIPPITP